MFSEIIDGLWSNLLLRIMTCDTSAHDEGQFGKVRILVKKNFYNFIDRNYYFIFIIIFFHFITPPYKKGGHVAVAPGSL